METWTETAGHIMFKTAARAHYLYLYLVLLFIVLFRGICRKKSGKSVVFCQQACIKVFGAWDPKKVPGNVRNECA